MLYYQRLLFVPEIIRTKHISRHHNNLLTSYFDINQTRKLIGRKYYQPNLQKNVEVYIKDCNICLFAKKVKYKPYDKLQLLLISTYCYKNFSIDFVTRLLISTNWKNKSYDSILVIFNPLTKIIFYELVKMTINIPRLAKIILDMVIQHHGLCDLIIFNGGLLFILKF